MASPGFTAAPHPGPVSRLGTSNGDALRCPNGSPAISGVNGMPSDALKIPLNCQPRTSFTDGRFQMAWTTAMRGMLKSETPRATFESYHGRPPIEFENALPTRVDEPVSILWLHVNEPWS